MSRLVEYTGPIIDTHAFLGGSDKHGVPDPNDYMFKDSKVDGINFLVMPFSAKDNLTVVGKMQADSRMLGSYLMFSPNEASDLYVPEDGVEYIEMVAGQEYVVGMKTLPSMFRIPMNDRRYDPYYRLAERKGLPVLEHAASSGKDYDSPDMAVEIMERFPNMKLILAHFGGLHPRYMEAAAVLMDRYPQLYLNTTGLDQIGRQQRVSNTTFERKTVTDLTADQVELLRNEALEIVKSVVATHPKKVVHGSDLGFHSVEDYSLWPLSELTIEEMISAFHTNALRLFPKMKKAI